MEGRGHTRPLHDTVVCHDSLRPETLSADRTPQIVAKVSQIRIAQRWRISKTRHPKRN